MERPPLLLRRDGEAAAQSRVLVPALARALCATGGAGSVRGAVAVGAGAAVPGIGGEGREPPMYHMAPAVARTTNPKTTASARRDMDEKSIEISGRR